MLPKLIPLLLLCVTGAVAHYGYPLCGRKRWMAPFFPVNESVWEHVKLLYFPAIILTVVEYCHNPALVCPAARMAGVLFGTAFMIAGYYTYSGIIGRNYLPADILLYDISCVIFYAVSRRPFSPADTTKWGIAMILLGLCLVLFTYHPPRLPLFMDNLKGTYGLEK